jgi:preprotein translocase subunit SecG
MLTVVLVIHVLLAIALIGIILIQQSEGGGLVGGSGGGMGSFMNPRGTANLLTRITGILAAAFMVTSVSLAVLANMSGPKKSILDTIPAEETTAPAAPVGIDQKAGTKPAENNQQAPAVPLSQ